MKKNLKHIFLEFQHDRRGNIAFKAGFKTRFAILQLIHCIDGMALVYVYATKTDLSYVYSSTSVHS